MLVYQLLRADAKNKVDIARELLCNVPLFYDEVFQCAQKENRRRFGSRLSLYAISYIADACVNHCLYCGHSAAISRNRQALSPEGMRFDFSAILQHGPGEFCILAGEAPSAVRRIITAVRILNELNPVFGNPLRQISLNIAPLGSEGFRTLLREADSAIPLQFRVFQETYDQDSYRFNHPAGPKRDFEFRYNAQARAMAAGFSSVGVGALLGINPKGTPGNDDEIVSLIHHAYLLKRQTGHFPASVAIPRLQSTPEKHIDYGTLVEDQRYIFYLSLLRLALPYTKIYITARETASFIRSVETIINVRDLAPRPGVGGNLGSCHPRTFQNILGDPRGAVEIITDLKQRNKLFLV